MKTRLPLVLLALCHGALQAQDQPLAGAWQINYPAGMRIENDVATPIFTTGSLTIQAQGDSLIGTLVSAPPAGLPARPPARLAAKAGAGDVTFIAHSKATIMVNGAQSEAAVVSTWVLRAKGDSLEGTVVRKIDSADAGPQEPGAVTGVRKKG